MRDPQLADGDKPLRFQPLIGQAACADSPRNWAFYAVPAVAALQLWRASVFPSFKSPEAERIFRRVYVRKLPHDIQRTALRKLWMIDAAPDLISLRVPPGHRLEALAGNRARQHSIRINDQWRICFRWREGNAHDVEIVDYHQET
jgi:proteic killer suppression protein